ncbi:MAG TPA: hypothetical protein VF115_00075 [Acidimicrobiia bacterium]
MEAVVETTEDGKTRVHIGITVCEGPGQHRLLLTKPYNQAGQVIEIPHSQINEVKPLDDASEHELDELSESV